MRRHVRVINENIRSHACPFCNRTFGSNTEVRNHLARTHPSELLQPAPWQPQAFQAVQMEAEAEAVEEAEGEAEVEAEALVQQHQQPLPANRLPVGSVIELLWPASGTWYAATIIGQQADSQPPPAQAESNKGDEGNQGEAESSLQTAVQYHEDGSCEELCLGKLDRGTWRVPPQPQPLPSQPQQRQFQQSQQFQQQPPGGRPDGQQSEQQQQQQQQQLRRLIAEQVEVQRVLQARARQARAVAEASTAATTAADAAEAWAAEKDERWSSATAGMSAAATWAMMTRARAPPMRSASDPC